MTKHDSPFRIKTARRYTLLSMNTKKKWPKNKIKMFETISPIFGRIDGGFFKNVFFFFCYINLIKISLSFRSPFVFVVRESDELDERANFN